MSDLHPEQIAACQGKSSFPNYLSARKRADWMRKRDKEAVAPYRCRFCHQWHIGSANKRQSDKRELHYEPRAE